MIISKTPCRISFFGGGTDYPSWYLKNGGEVLSATIDKHIYIHCRYLPPFFKHRLIVHYSKIEMCNSYKEIQHPAVREVLNFLSHEKDLEIYYIGDLPGRSGLGSSSAFTVGLLNALSTYLGRTTSRHQLATESIHIEQNLIGETVGSQDQVNAAYGGLNHIRFMQNGEILVHPAKISQKRINRLDDNLMLFYTGIMRTAEEIAKSYVDDIHSKEKQLSFIQDAVKEGIDILNSDRDLNEFGVLLHETWLVKRSLSSRVSNTRVDQIYEAARSAGAIGGKLSGAGGGGFLLLFVPPKKQSAVKKNLKNLVHVPFHIESNGSQIIFYDAQQRYLKEEEVRSNNPYTNPIELKHIK
jgi:D-glycero-alpha-D-manno-heptose-7-phosphate kinase